MENILITGYRAHELGNYNNKHQGIPYIRKAIANRLVPLRGRPPVGHHARTIWRGPMAIEAAIELKSQYPNLKCSILTAYQNPEEQWNDDKSLFSGSDEGVDFYAPVSKGPYQGPWRLRPGMICFSARPMVFCSCMTKITAKPAQVHQRACPEEAGDRRLPLYQHRIGGDTGCCRRGEHVAGLY